MYKYSKFHQILTFTITGSERAKRLNVRLDCGVMFFIVEFEVFSQSESNMII
jgi:hypothetical protein